MVGNYAGFLVTITTHSRESCQQSGMMRWGIGIFTGSYDSILFIIQRLWPVIILVLVTCPSAIVDTGSECPSVNAVD